MKVLFAVHDEKVSSSIVKKYQKEYKEIISYKNVYYFNAILKELQRDKTYNRIIIDEDLEEFTSSSYEQKDKFVFEKLDNITDEATGTDGNDIPIILICSERRMKSEEFLIKLFGIGIYNAIIGNDRSTDQVCRLINKPRSKKEAKTYYRIDSEDAGYQPEKMDDVSEEEMQHILSYFKKLGKNEDRYVECFRNIVSQYNEKQMRIIISILPLHVKSILEEKSPEYQKMVSQTSGRTVNNINNYSKTQKLQGTSEKLLTNKKSTSGRPIVVPSKLEKTLIKNINTTKPSRPTINFVPSIEDEEEDNEIIDTIEELEELEEVPQAPKKRGRGRPKKDSSTELVKEENSEESTQEPKKRGRGRPRKNPLPKQEENKNVSSGFNNIEEENQFPGFNDIEDDEDILPGFNDIEEDEDTLPGFNDVEEDEDTLPGFNDIEEDDDILPGFNDVEEDEETLPGFNDIEEDEDTLPGFNDVEEDEETLPGFNDVEEDEETLPGFNDVEEDEDILPGFNDVEEDEDILPGFNDIEEDEETLPGFSNIEEDEDTLPEFNNVEDDEDDVPLQRFDNIKKNKVKNNNRNSLIDNETQDYDYSEYNSLLSSTKKVIAFVGTSKNGTSFIVNNIAKILSDGGIDTAILDTTQNKNAYYIYTKNEEDLRQTAAQSIKSLIYGKPEGIRVKNNLTVYAELPNKENDIVNVGPILENLIKMHSAVLIDCDFNTPIEYFKNVQELYLVQSMDVLTIQPLTAFLRELKAKDIIDENKIKIIINKAVKLKGVTSKTIVGGMAYYNDPEMSFMTELFDRNSMVPIEIPFDFNVYERYLEEIIDCEISVDKYPKEFQNILKNLACVVYPLLPAKKTKEKNKKGYQYSTNYSNNGFSNSVNNTLNNMKKKY